MGNENKTVDYLTGLLRQNAELRQEIEVKNAMIEILQKQQNNQGNHYSENEVVLISNSMFYPQNGGING